jgi:hypothetical protein
MSCSAAQSGCSRWQRGPVKQPLSQLHTDSYRELTGEHTAQYVETARAEIHTMSPRKERDMKISKARSGNPHQPAAVGSIASAVAYICVLLLATTGIASATALYVSATAKPGGDGSRSRPFNSLAAVEQASASGDRIIVLSSPWNATPLDGGITLKPGQKLIGDGPRVINMKSALASAPRITNTTEANSGDAVALANHTNVSNLIILNSRRGAIYGSNVTDVIVDDNNISGTNTSCAPGYYVYFPSNSAFLANGWAAIMVDESVGSAMISIKNNYIHDGNCNDGIDIRAMQTAEVVAHVDSNDVTRLAQGASFRSLLAIGMQTRDTAQLKITSDHNSETYIGSAKADCEGLFTNQTGGSLSWNISHNTFAHGIGGASCNGAEFYVPEGTSITNLNISHSTFDDNPGDMIEEFNAGVGATMNLTIEDVTVNHTTLAIDVPPEAKFTRFGNLSRCMDQAGVGTESVTKFHMIRSRFSDCAGDGVGSFVVPDVAGGTGTFGPGSGDSLSIEIEKSTITGTQQSALHFSNGAAINQIAVKIEDSLLGNARGPIIAFDQNSSTQDTKIDLGGGQLNSLGNNCIIGARSDAVEITGYNVSARNNWWGSQTGPLPVKISLTSGTLNAATFLRQPPTACREADKRR